jgi:hypothetical protein
MTTKRSADAPSGGGRFSAQTRHPRGPDSSFVEASIALAHPLIRLAPGSRAARADRDPHDDTIVPQNHGNFVENLHERASVSVIGLRHG